MEKIKSLNGYQKSILIFMIAMTLILILPAIFEPPVRTFGATIPVFESQLFQ